LSDIPFSNEIFLELEAIVKETRTRSEIENMNALKSPKMAVMWEFRYKIVNQLLAKYDLHQYLEVAAGFSPRGLNLAADPRATCVEMDLPGVIQEKKRIVERLTARGVIPDRFNFHPVEGNVLRLADLFSAVDYFAQDQPIAVLNEGLLPYLTHAERATFAGNVHTVLEQFGGVWITPDIDIQLPENTSPKDRLAVKARTGKIDLLTGVDVLKNRFENEEVARVFFERLGFHVERHSFMELADQLVLPPQGSLAEKAIARAVCFVMTVSGQSPS
jgi:O-methyltransferase involved in polyketide biosynthesis